MKPKARQENIIVQDLRGETLIYDLTTNKAFCLNATSSFVWQNCDGEKEVGEIAEGLARKNRQPVHKDIVRLAIDQLEKDNLMAEAGHLPDFFQGMNRREVIKKLGLTTMIALPVVVGLTAPTAAHAASCVALGGSCTSAAQCCPSPSGVGCVNQRCAETC